MASPIDSYVELVRSGSLGAVHISCVKKDHGKVSSDDLHEWAAELGHPEVAWGRVQVGSLDGLGRQRIDGSMFRAEWYLGAGNLMLFVTFHCPVGRETEELPEVERVLSCIELKSAGA